MDGVCCGLKMEELQHVSSVIPDVSYYCWNMFSAQNGSPQAQDNNLNRELGEIKMI